MGEAITARADRAGVHVIADPGTDLSSAVSAARRADLVVYFAYDQEREGDDRPDLSLPNEQDAFIEQLTQANPHTVVVLDTGGPVLMPWLDQVPAVLEAWYPGEQDGNAIAAVLFGDADPGGRLPQTFPAANDEVPASTPGQWPGSGDGQDASFGERLDVGYRWYDAHKVAPLFPFGYGLSYTSFTYDKLRIVSSGPRVAVSFTVTNTGARAGSDVPQLYVDDPAFVGEPPKQLQGYERVFLRPGKSTQVTIPLTPQASTGT